MAPYPVRRDPGSTPRMTMPAGALLREGAALARGRRGLQLLVRDVEVRPHVLHVVVVLEGLHELEHLLGLAPFEGDRVVRVLADLGLLGLDAGLLDRGEDRLVGVLAPGDRAEG